MLGCSHQLAAILVGGAPSGVDEFAVVTYVHGVIHVHSCLEGLFLGPFGGLSRIPRSYQGAMSRLVRRRS